MRRRLAAVLAAAALTLAGCSGTAAKGGTTDTQADKGLPVQGATLTYDPNHLVNDGKPITLEWWLWDGDTQFQAFADAYTKIHPNVSIKIVKQPWEDYWTKLPLALKSGGPALFNIHNSQNDNLMPYLAPYGVDVDALTADYTGAAAHVIDGKVYYIDYGMMTGLIFYNKKMWSEAGLTDADIPATWDQFREVAKKLTKKDGKKFTQAGFNFNALFKEVGLGLPYQRGYNLMAEDMKTPAIDNKGMLENLQMFLDMYNVDGVGSKDFGPAAADSFGQGQSAMIYNWGHFYGTLKNDFPDIDFGTFKTPVPDAAQTPYAFDRYNGESTLGINKGADADQQAVAQDFVAFFLTDKEDLKQLVLNYSLYPSYKPLESDAELLANPVVASLGEADRYIWPGPMPATFEDNIDKMYQEVIYNGKDPAEALKAAQAAIAADLAKADFTSTENLYVHYQPSPAS